MTSTNTAQGHCVGQRPTNPLITDKWVYVIANVKLNEAPEDMVDGMDHWSYDIIEQISLVDYTKTEMLRIQVDNLDRDEIIASLLEGGGIT